MLLQEIEAMAADAGKPLEFIFAVEAEDADAEGRSNNLIEVARSRRSPSCAVCSEIDEQILKDRAEELRDAQPCCDGPAALCPSCDGSGL